MTAAPKIRSYRSTDYQGVLDLWNIVFTDEPAWNASEVLIRDKLTVQPHLFFVAEIDERVVGTVLAGYDGVRGWVHKVATHPDYRRRAIAASLMQAAETGLRDLGCKKMNLQVRNGNDRAAAFYQSIGYQAEDRLSFGKLLDPPELSQARIRAQYHFRESPDGLLAWDVRKLMEQSSDLPVVQVQLEDISEYDNNHWFSHNAPTVRALVEHLELIDAADLSFPIILSEQGWLMDGMHRVCKAHRLGRTSLPAVQFTSDPAPDFVGVAPADLPYDD